MQESIETLRTELEKRVRFETLLAETSARFVNLPADKVDGEIRGAQRLMCEFLDLDRSSLGQVSEREDGAVPLTHIHQPQGSKLPEGLDGRAFWPWTAQRALSGETVIIRKVSDLPPEAGRDRESFSLYGIKSFVVAPLSIGGRPPFGVLSFSILREERDWPETVVKGFQLISQVFANALARKQMEEQLQANLREIASLKQRLEEENIYLRKEANLIYTHEEIIGRGEPIRQVLAQVEKVARTDSTVLITGETGTGKELIARAIHNLSNRKDRLMVTVNCASLPPTLIESELFGREKGAYTGAMTRQMGRFEIADGATLFLDEIGELPLELQAKFLRVLENGEFERIGSTVKIKVNVRIIAATNRNLAEEIRLGKFRQDLFYRLNVFPIKAPPLREHPGDIPLVINSLIEEFAKKMGKRIHSVPKKTMEDLQRYSWPGNVRELRNLVEQAFIVSSGDTLRIQVPRETVSAPSGTLTADEMERQHIIKVLEITKGRIKGRHGAAEILGLKPSTLYSRMVKFGIISSPKKGDI
jgi:formate hydrogenlyase transcriptional activator